MKSTGKNKHSNKRLKTWLERSFHTSPRAAIEFVIAATSLIFADPTLVSIAVGLSISLVGLSLRIWTAGYGYKIGEISFRGPYRYVRHPYFLGTALLFIGLCVAGRNPWVMAFALAAVGFAYRRDIRRDEQRLGQNFGPAFGVYRAKVPAFIPQLWPASVPGIPAGPRFSFNYSIFTGRRREIDAIIGLGAAFALFYLCYWLTAKDLFQLGVAFAATAFLLGRLVYFHWMWRPIS